MPGTIPKSFGLEAATRQKPLFFFLRFGYDYGRSHGCEEFVDG
jgi:hypothetical protein